MTTAIVAVPVSTVVARIATEVSAPALVLTIQVVVARLRSVAISWFRPAPSPSAVLLRVGAIKNTATVQACVACDVVVPVSVRVALRVCYAVIAIARRPASAAPGPVVRVVPGPRLTFVVHVVERAARAAARAQ